MFKIKAMRFGLLSLSAGALLAACDGGETTVEINPDEEEMTDTDSEGNTSDESAGIEDMAFSVTLDDSINDFYETFGSEDINISEIQFDQDDDQYAYEIDGWDGEFHFTLITTADIGQTLDQEQEVDSEEEDILDLEDIVTPQEAMEAALEESGSGYVEEWDLEVENDQTIYTIDIEDGDDQQIDALTGEVL